MRVFGLDGATVECALLLGIAVRGDDELIIASVVARVGFFPVGLSDNSIFLVVVGSQSVGIIVIVVVRRCWVLLLLLCDIESIIEFIP